MMEPSGNGAVDDAVASREGYSGVVCVVPSESGLDVLVRCGE